METVGYARVSSVGQSLKVQLDQIKYCNKIYKEKHSATSNKKRPKLSDCIEYVKEWDVLVVTRLDPLARSILDLCEIEKTLERKKVHLKVLDQNIDTSDVIGKLLFNMLGSINQFETEIRAGRQMDGIRKGERFRLLESRVI